MDTSSESVRDLVHDFILQLAIHNHDLLAAQEAAIPCLRRLLAKADLYQLGIPRSAGRHEVNSAVTLYYDPDLHIVVAKMAKGTVVAPHTHATWEAVGVFSGDFEYSLYKNSQDLHAHANEARLLESNVLRMGQIKVFPPGPAHSHGFRALTDVVTLGVRPPERSPAHS